MNVATSTFFPIQIYFFTTEEQSFICGGKIAICVLWKKKFFTRNTIHVRTQLLKNRNVGNFYFVLFQSRKTHQEVIFLFVNFIQLLKKILQFFLLHTFSKSIAWSFQFIDPEKCLKQRVLRRLLVYISVCQSMYRR